MLGLSGFVVYGVGLWDSNAANCQLPSFRTAATVANMSPSMQAPTALFANGTEGAAANAAGFDHVPRH